MKHEIVCTYPFPERNMQALLDYFTVHEYWKAKDGAALLRSVADRVRGIATAGFGSVPGSMIEALPKLEIVSNFGVGVDSIDLKTAKKHKVVVTNTPDVLNEEVADTAIALMLALTRRIVFGDKYVRTGKWKSHGPMALTTSVTDKTMGIVGLGRIGLAIARRAEAMTMRVAYHNRNRRTDVPYPYYSDPAALAAVSDVLMVITPGGAGTRNLIDARVLAALGRRGILVNVARGSVVDEPALVKALVGNQIAGAALDVFADEPNVPKELLGLDHVVLAPHVGSATVETRHKMGSLAVANLISWYEGKGAITPYPL
ncbi:MAG: 2-hydroxyacid dehydrogenase [Alphaproteobacteria bacterium]|nr:2-hydroxyacid dehydrogenase [Alphaproteobacteria bacterium]